MIKTHKVSFERKIDENGAIYWTLVVDKQHIGHFFICILNGGSFRLFMGGNIGICADYSNLQFAKYDLIQKYFKDNYE